MGSYNTGDIGEYKKTSKRPLIFAILGGSVLIALGLALGLGLGLRANSAANVAVEESTTTTSVTTAETTSEATGPPQESSATGTYRFAAVASDAKECSEIGTDIMARRGGNAVDAAIATMLCIGVVHRQSCGIGGGHFMTIYMRENKTSFTLDAREMAPLAANETMYINRTDNLTSLLGGLAVGVPGDIKGYWEAHKRFGKVLWKDLFQPTIRMCREGVRLTEATHTALARYSEILKERNHSAYFDPNTGEPKAVGEKIFLPELAETLETVANVGESAFYNGVLTDKIVQEVQENGGIITRADLMGYRATWREPIQLTLRDNMTIHSMPPPGSGVVYAYMLNVLDGYNFTPDNLSSREKSILTYHRIVEAMKFAYAKRSSLGDGDFVNVTELVQNMTSRDFADEIRSQINDDRTEDTDYYGPSFSNKLTIGTSHASVLDSNGNAVSITSTINTYFGSKVRGSQTGIAYNNEMDDFSTPGTTNTFGVPASPSNFIKPGKRPMSSMCPTVIVDRDGNVVEGVGAAGGTRITTSSMLVSLYTLRFGLTMGQALDHKRLHHQLLPKEIRIEEGFPKEIIDGLISKGHNVTIATAASVVNGYHVTDTGIHAASDFRKLGGPDGY